MGRAQKYYVRPRHLYALLFPHGAAYIGQTIDLKERLRDHRAPAGGWASARFEMIPLSLVHGTYEDAEHHEYAWRYAAYKAGWRIYGKPGIYVSPTRRMNMRRHLIASRCRWPKAYRRNRWTVGKTVGLVLALTALWFLLTLLGFVR